MSHIDRRTGEVVMRVVYDGAPEAGKTTNIVKLCEAVSLHRRGEVQDPGAPRRRTEFFDWADFVGGSVDGRKVRCQVVSVPGQSQLLHRRRYLLESADAVVFVADSRADHIAPTLDSLLTTLRIVERLSTMAQVGLVLQANKQDLPGALAPRALATAFQFPEYGAVVGARAHEGEGVMQAFMQAVRQATSRIRTLALGGQLMEGQWTEPDDPEKLYAAMLQREPSVTSARPRRSDPAAETEAKRAKLALAPLPARRNPAGDTAPPELPATSELLAGHIWPAATGRRLLANVGLDD
ncbi:MAG TPA: ADP-ribosylation factor-like protein, partial [Polyangiales bacterium]